MLVHLSQVPHVSTDVHTYYLDWIWKLAIKIDRHPQSLRTINLCVYCIYVLVPFVRGVKKKPSYLSASTKNTCQHEYIPWDPTREVSSISFASRKIPQFPSHTKSRFEGAGFVLQANIVWLQFLHLQTSCIKTNMPQHVERQGRNKQIYSQMFVKGSSPMPQFMHLHDECLISGCKCCHPITSSVFSAFLFNIEHLPTFSSDRSHVLTNLNISSPMLLTWE